MGNDRNLQFDPMFAAGPSMPLLPPCEAESQLIPFRQLPRMITDAQKQPPQRGGFPSIRIASMLMHKVGFIGPIALSVATVGPWQE